MIFPFTRITRLLTLKGCKQEVFFQTPSDSIWDFICKVWTQTLGSEWILPLEWMLVTYEYYKCRNCNSNHFTFRPHFLNVRRVKTLQRLNVLLNEWTISFTIYLVIFKKKSHFVLKACRLPSVNLYYKPVE